MIFPNLETENILQTNDKTRLDASKTFKSPDEAAITLIEIQPSAGDSFYDVTSDMYLDWQYAAAGTQTVSLRITTDGAPVVSTKDIEVLSEVDDHLFSSDAELVQFEDDIMSYVRAGRNSYKDKHRAAQDTIVKWLDEKRIWDQDGNPLTKEAIIDIDEVNRWSRFLTLQFIFESLSNAIDDIFQEKAKKYAADADNARARAAIRLDRDGDGSTDDESPKDLRTFRLLRR